MKKLILAVIANLFLVSAAQASIFSETKCWDSFKKAPEGLVSLCQLSVKEGKATTNFFVAKFEDREEFYPVANVVLPLGGKCFWATGYKLISLDEYSTSASSLKTGFVKFCDENGETKNKLTGTLPGGLVIVTEGK